MWLVKEVADDPPALGRPREEARLMLEGVDYSYSRPTAAQLKAAGKQFALRYVSSSGHAKNLTRSEADALKTTGIAIGIVYELTASRALDGRATGRTDAASARAQVAALGGPADGGVIYFAVDFDAQPHQMDAVMAYGTGWADVLGKGRCGPYGSYRVCKAFLDAGFAYAWQTYAWSGGQWDPRAQLRQYRNNVTLGSGTVDLCRSMADDFGQWDRQEDDLTEEQARQLKAVYDQVTGAVGAGQTSFQGTVEATLATVQALVNEGRSQSSTLATKLDSMRSALLGAIAALPTAHLSEDERNELAVQIATRVSQAGVQLDPVAVLDALALRLAA
jgi:hypothetical protein